MLSRPIRIPFGVIQRVDSPCLPAVDNTVKCSALGGGLARSETEVCAAAACVRNSADKAIVNLMNPPTIVDPSLHPLELPPTRVSGRQEVIDVRKSYTPCSFDSPPCRPYSTALVLAPRR